MAGDEATHELIAAARGGDRAAFDALAALHRPRLQRVIELRLGAELRRRLTLDDVLQETFLRAFRGIARFADVENGAFGRWLSGIAVKVILEAANRPKADRFLALEVDVPARAQSPGKALQREERFERLKAALEALSPDQREAVMLVRLEGLSVAEAARRMDRTPNAISHLLLRAMRTLRLRMGDTESHGLPPRRLELDNEAEGDSHDG
jgi:RNA polymerase sigma-70 factor (ECF subfamily)